MNYIDICIKKKYVKFLQTTIGFNDWQLSLLDERPYAKSIVRVLSRYYKEPCNKNGVVVEVGCGLGEIIGSIPVKKKYGYDINGSNIKAAKFLHPLVKFRNGSFRDIKNCKIDCLIMVNFIHCISHDDLKNEIHELLNYNEVKMFVIDTFVNNKGTGYKYAHNGELLFGGDYYLNKRSQGFATAEGARRYIEYWVRK